MNLDDMLDDVDMDSLKPTKKAADLDDILNDAASSVLPTPAPKKEVDLDQELKIRIVSDQIKPWLAFTANAPADLREKWTKMMKVDSETEVMTKFHPSSAYKQWDPSTSSKPAITKSLQDLVRKSASKSGIDDARTAKILSIVNPVTDTEHGKQLQNAFAKQLVNDLKDDIKNDPNFSAAKFPSLAEAVGVN